MQEEKAYHARLDNYLNGIEDYELVGWQEESPDLATKYPFTERLPRTERRPLPFLKLKDRKDCRKCIEDKLSSTITSRLFCPAKAAPPPNITSIKFMGPRDLEPYYSSCQKSNRKLYQKPTKAVSRLLIQLPPECNQMAQSRTFLLQGQRSSYYSKKSKRKPSPLQKYTDPKDPLFQQMLSLTLPSFNERLSKSLKRPMEQWFSRSRQTTLNKVSQQVKSSRRSYNQKVTL